MAVKIKDKKEKKNQTRGGAASAAATLSRSVEVHLVGRQTMLLIGFIVMIMITLIPPYIHIIRRQRTTDKLCP